MHIDGRDMLAYFSGKADKSPRDSFFYVNDDGQLVALRFGDWKLVFLEQRARQLQCWLEPFVELRAPKVFNLRRDPFERADENSNTYYDWFLDHAFVLVPAQAYVAEHLQSFNEFPPRQKPASFNLSRVLENLQTADRTLGRGRAGQTGRKGVEATRKSERSQFAAPGAMAHLGRTPAGHEDA